MEHTLYVTLVSALAHWPHLAWPNAGFFLNSEVVYSPEYLLKQDNNNNKKNAILFFYYYFFVVGLLRRREGLVILRFEGKRRYRLKSSYVHSITSFIIPFLSLSLSHSLASFLSKSRRKTKPPPLSGARVGEVKKAKHQYRWKASLSSSSSHIHGSKENNSFTKQFRRHLHILRRLALLLKGGTGAYLSSFSFFLCLFYWLLYDSKNHHHHTYNGSFSFFFCSLLA